MGAWLIRVHPLPTLSRNLTGEGPEQPCRRDLPGGADRRLGAVQVLVNRIEAFAQYLGNELNLRFADYERRRDHDRVAALLRRHPGGLGNSYSTLHRRPQQLSRDLL